MTTVATPRLTALTTDHRAAVLRANAIFSAISATGMLVFAVPLAEWLAVSKWLLVGAGAALAVFAGVVLVVSAQPSPPPWIVGAIAAADFLWVVGAVLVIGVPGTLPGGGKLALGLVSLIVLDFGVLEWIGYRRMRSRS